MLHHVGELHEGIVLCLMSWSGFPHGPTHRTLTKISRETS